MGLDEPEDIIPGIIAVVSVLGIIGALTTYIPVIGDVPVLNFLSGSIHAGFMFLGGFLTPLIGVEAFFLAIIFEVILTILCIWIIVHFGF
ncbi:hypothetical protein GF352_01840|nr:hypothetical protein [archaeon]